MEEKRLSMAMVTHKYDGEWEDKARSHTTQEIGRGVPVSFNK
jgi:hypothetical protein